MGIIMYSENKTKNLFLNLGDVSQQAFGPTGVMKNIQIGS